jgi:hypothetical protein
VAGSTSQGVVARNEPTGFRSCGRSIGQNLSEVELEASKITEVAAASCFKAGIDLSRLRNTTTTRSSATIECANTKSNDSSIVPLHDQQNSMQCYDV